MPTMFVRIPEDRVGVLIGPNGSTKREIARWTRTIVEIDAEEGEVTVTGADDDPSGVLTARDIVAAIGRGFSPERARRLLTPETYLGVVDLKQATPHREKSALRRIRARLIGSDGRARRRIEELSGASVSVYGSTVAVIGTERQIEHAVQAIEMLVRGSEHSTVFHLLARWRRTDALDRGDDAGAGE